MQIYNSVYKSDKADKNQETILNCYKTISSDVFSEKNNLSSFQDPFSNNHEPNSPFFSTNSVHSGLEPGINGSTNGSAYLNSNFGHGRHPTNPMALAINR